MNRLRPVLAGSALFAVALVSATAQSSRPEQPGRIENPIPGQIEWHFKEGTFHFNPFFYELLNPPSDGFVFANAPCQPADMIDPMAQYDHDAGTAVIGGFVYRGPDPGFNRFAGAMSSGIIPGGSTTETVRCSGLPRSTTAGRGIAPHASSS